MNYSSERSDRLDQAFYRAALVNLRPFVGTGPEVLRYLLLLDKKAAFWDAVLDWCKTLTHVVLRASFLGLLLFNVLHTYEAAGAWSKISVLYWFAWYVLFGFFAEWQKRAVRSQNTSNP